MSERDLIERLAIRAARFEASPGNDLIYGQGEAQTDKEAAATIARLSEALAEAEKKAVSAEAIIGRFQRLVTNVEGWVVRGLSETATKAMVEARKDGWTAMGWKPYLDAERAKGGKADG